MSIQVRNISIAEKLRLIGNLITLEGEKNSNWRAKAYFKAADILMSLDMPAEQVLDWQDFSGIGKGLSSVIQDLMSLGSCQQLDTLKAKYPGAEDAFKLTSVSGIGVKKAIGLYQQGIKNLQDLSLACDKGQITNKQIIQGVKLALRSRGRLSILEVRAAIQSVYNFLSLQPEVKQISFAGSVRRGSETIKDADIIVVSTNRDKTAKQFTSLGEVLVFGNEKVRVMVPIDLDTSIQMDLLFSNENSFGAALSYFTGSKEHNIALRKLANNYGYTLNEHGFYYLNGERWGGSTEEELYQKLNLPWCPPELREGSELLTQIPDLISELDIKSDYHMHSLYSSDARSSIDEMVAASKLKGYEEIAITDHTESNYGWNPKDIETRKQECLLASEKYGIKVLAGCEVGINLDGSLDWPDEYLAKMDFVIASIHRQHGSENYVDRLISASQNKYVKMIGHPTGAIIGKRNSGMGDWEKLFESCRTNNVFLEINGARLDLPVELIKRANSNKCQLKITSDAHHVSHLDWISNSITLARRAGLERK